ncbi:hypothetical protein OG705_28935 [Streptomyces sp. NBC_00838]|nr:hypothetical protein OG705_28935 [Streptomyces sp. NBC_00838]
MLDPFAGSSTTRLAARDEGMCATGVERCEPYARMSEPESVGLFNTAP